MVSSIDAPSDEDLLRVERASDVKRTGQMQHSVESLLGYIREEVSRAAGPTTNSRLFKHAASEKLAYHVLSDVVMFLASLTLAYALSSVFKMLFLPGIPPIPVDTAIYMVPVLFFLPMAVTMMACARKGHYSRYKGFWEELGEFIQIGLTMATLSVAYLFFARFDFSRLWLLTTWALVFALVPLGRYATKHWLMKRGRWFTPTVVIGSGQNARESALAIESNILMGFQVVALMDIGSLEKLAYAKDEVSIRDEIGRVTRTFNLMRPDGEIKDEIQVFGRPYFVLALEAEDYTVHEAILEELAASQNNMSIIPPLRGLPLMGTEIAPIFRHEVLHLRIRNSLANPIPRLVKRLFDVSLSAVGLIALSPLFLYLILRIRSDGGRAFYAQRRIGRNGIQFRCWKFRSMVVDADARLRELLSRDPLAREEYEKTQKLRNDPRITPVGEFLRSTSLDELPQLWNVLVGDMSLVGPRPVRQDELALYGPQARYYLDTRPGITGLWQISGRNELDYSTRVNLDSWYVRNWSLWYDLTILFKTTKAVLGRDGAY